MKFKEYLVLFALAALWGASFLSSEHPAQAVAEQALSQKKG